MGTSFFRAVRPWPWFFLAVAVCIVVTMTVPTLFGLQNVTQWGAMYTDAWCSIYVYDSDPGTNSSAKSEQLWAGRVGTVYSVPMFNEEMCLMWSRKYCGKPATDGWTIRWVSPYYKKKEYFKPKNPCDLTLDASYDWFRYAP